MTCQESPHMRVGECFNLLVLIGSDPQHILEIREILFSLGDLFRDRFSLGTMPVAFCAAGAILPSQQIKGMLSDRRFHISF